MKKRTTVFVAAAVCCVLLLSAVSFGGDASIARRMGDAFRRANTADARQTNRGSLDAPTAESPNDGDTVAARYGDFVVTWADIRYQQDLAEALPQSGYDAMDARSVAERLIGGQLALEEAERRGFTFTDAEIQTYMEDLRAGYDTLPEYRAWLDEYCDAAGLTVEEYFQTQEDQAYATFTRERFRAWFYEQWEAENAGSPPDDPAKLEEAKLSAYDAYIATLLERHQDKIVYYMD